MTPATAPAADDPRPLPPNRPDDDACCGSGCDPCIFDFYYEEMERYRQELRDWLARHPGETAA
ncbi:oxidoreductase-like domain-containing protein [Cupriavidus sp. AU9028]|uniref:oxidoreductase-like domain-containing protein n=1 Tax=Cupriavidus sp. AU9028 TaxID=2871157 RepID=UPI00351D1EC5